MRSDLKKFDGESKLLMPTSSEASSDAYIISLARCPIMVPRPMARWQRMWESSSQALLCFLLYAAAYAVDPLFHQTSAQFDEGSTRAAAVQPGDLAGPAHHV